eukprot:TRINITY_DN2844_c0_g1_i2.p1 TRINITY_DN2844_c0_g1~~TRINITY_DN2844_c0_g1_i2.p1  ORF type:complete len:322 (-),score=37.35 TRINITY_DN2844_c0_g1_i2:416-1381(-)
MSLFEKTVQIDHVEVRGLVHKHWNLELGDIIKASQNHTFKAHSKTGDAFAVRVTPDPDRLHRDRISQEVQFVLFVVAHNLEHVCAPIPTVDGEFVVNSGHLVIVVSQWAKGAPLDFFSYRWVERDVVVAWGMWLAELHRISRLFTTENAGIAKKIQRWDQIHHGILEGSEIHPDDQAVVEDPQHFGVLHGDLNVSNFFFAEETKEFHVFDWDQVQQGWYLWDVAQSELTVYMLAEAGSLVDGSPVPQADPATFEGWMVEGYESVAGAGSVDRARLTRMVNLRKSFYEKFCVKAQEQGDVPAHMSHFINYVVNWFAKLKPGQ